MWYYLKTHAHFGSQILFDPLLVLCASVLQVIFYKKNKIDNIYNQHNWQAASSCVFMKTIFLTKDIF